MKRGKKKDRKGKPDGRAFDRRSQIWWLALGGAVVAAIAVTWFADLVGTKRYESARPNDTAGDEKTVLAQYGGSASCQTCHKEIYAEWKSSNHGLAERPPVSAIDERAFNPPRTFQHGSQKTSVSQTNGRDEITMLGPENREAQFPVERVIGNDPLRQFLVKFPGGRLQSSEAAYDPHRDEWFNVYGNEDRKPGEWGHWTGRGMNWNSMCASCHNTRVRKNYDEASDSYHTTMADSTVGCEACHGPLKAHNDWQQKFGKSKKKDPTISKLNPEHNLQNCAYCHSRRSELTGDFKPGDDYFDHARLAIVDASETFYPDGQIHDEDYEFTAFLGSKMRMRGVNCMDCHNPHTAKTYLPGNALCMRCHNGSYANAPLIDPVAHSHHKVFGYDAKGLPTNIDLASYKPTEISETGGECVNCHMPQTTYMQRHGRHDHGFTIPDPLLTKEHGIPNACNRCHKDKNADWALTHCNDWYGEKMNRPSRIRAQVIAAARNGESSARDGLLGLLTTEQNPYWRAVAAGLLAPWASEASVSKALISGLTDTDALVRAECIRALEPLVEANTNDVADAIRKRLDDPFRNVRIAAAWALRRTIDPTSRAGAELRHSLEINADQPIGQMQKGAFAWARNDPEKALTSYAKAVGWDPNSAPIRNDYAVILASLNRSEEAAAQLEEACKLEPRNPEYRFRLGLALSERGDNAGTIEALQKAVQLDPRFAAAWYNLGLALNEAGRSQDGLSAFARAESLSPQDPRIPYARATILARLGQHLEARQAAERTLRIQPDYAPALQLLQSLPK